MAYLRRGVDFIGACRCSEVLYDRQMGDVGIRFYSGGIFIIPFAQYGGRTICAGELKVIYEYKNDESGEIIECDFPMGEASKTVTENGREYRRYIGRMTVIYGSTFHNEGQVKFKRGPIESDNEFV